MIKNNKIIASFRNAISVKPDRNMKKHGSPYNCPNNRSSAVCFNSSLDDITDDKALQRNAFLLVIA